MVDERKDQEGKMARSIADDSTMLKKKFAIDLFHPSFPPPFLYEARKSILQYINIFAWKHQKREGKCIREVFESEIRCCHMPRVIQRIPLRVVSYCASVYQTNKERERDVEKERGTVMNKR